MPRALFEERRRLLDVLRPGRGRPGCRSRRPRPRRRPGPAARPTPSAKPMSTSVSMSWMACGAHAGPGDQVVAGHVGPLVDGADGELRRRRRRRTSSGTSVPSDQSWSSATDRDTASCVGPRVAERRRPGRRGRAGRRAWPARPRRSGRRGRRRGRRRCRARRRRRPRAAASMSVARRGLSPPPPNWPPLMTRSAVTDCVTRSSTDALSEAANTVNRVTTLTPIISAAAGARRAAGVAHGVAAGQHAGDAPQPGQRRADGGAGRAGHDRAGDDHAHERDHGAEAGGARGVSPPPSRASSTIAHAEPRR